MKKWMKPAGIVAVVLTVAAVVYVRGRTPEAAAEDSTPEFEVAQRRSLEVTAEATGQIEPIRLIEVKSKASGEITRMLVESGDEVVRGTLLAEVDPRDVRNALSQAEADLEVARARVTTAEAQKKRSVELRAANVITEQEFESSTFEEANARAQFVKASTNVELARERMSDVTIRAPINGVIIRKDVEEGQIIQSASQNISGGTTVLVMADLSEMQVRTLVNETDLGKIQPGLEARVTVEAFPGRTFAGTVTKIEPQAVVEQNVTMFPVLVHLLNSDGALKPGMNAEVVVEVARRENVVTIPNAAVVSTRDATAAGALFGYSEEEMRTAMRGGGAGRGDQPGVAQSGAPAGGNAPAANGAAPQANGVAQATQPAAGGQLSAECTALREKITNAGGFQNATAEDRTKLRACMQQLGVQPGGNAQGGANAPAGGAAAANRAGGQMNAGAAQEGRGGVTRPGARGRRGGIGNADVRPALIFVQTDSTSRPVPRSVVLGVNDWDYTEVIRGVEPGERVLLVSVARLQSQQQEMLNRMRGNTGFPGTQTPGMGGPGGGRPGGTPGGGGGGGGGGRSGGSRN